MIDDFDYRAEMQEIEEYCSYLDTIFEEELLASWTLVQRTEQYALFQNNENETRIVRAQYIDDLFKE